ncbi:hypothetical protein M0802_000956 [Mischocyttarus mexicanus]|nr:hypothetical protein M0802_000956 [Mischocyttarus mexicanus]
MSSSIHNFRPTILDIVLDISSTVPNVLRKVCERCYSENVSLCRLRQPTSSWSWLVVVVVDDNDNDNYDKDVRGYGGVWWCIDVAADDRAKAIIITVRESRLQGRPLCAVGVRKESTVRRLARRPLHQPLHDRYINQPTNQRTMHPRIVCVYKNITGDKVALFSQDKYSIGNDRVEGTTGVRVEVQVRFIELKSSDMNCAYQYPHPGHPQNVMAMVPATSQQNHVPSTDTEYLEEADEGVPQFARHFAISTSKEHAREFVGGPSPD